MDQLTAEQINEARKVFEPSGGIKPEHQEMVDAIRMDAAVLLARISSIKPTGPESGRLVSLSKTSLETVVMWAIKAVSRL